MISFGAGWQTRGWRFCMGRQVGHRFAVGLFFRSHMHSSARTRAVVILFHVGGAVQGAVALVATGRQRPRHCSPINIQPASQAAVLPCLHEAQTGLGNGGELGGNHCKNGSNSGSVTSCHAERNGRGGEIRTWFRAFVEVRGKCVSTACDKDGDRLHRMAPVATSLSDRSSDK